MAAGSFRPPIDRVDELLLTELRRRDPSVVDLEGARGGRPVLLEELFPPAEDMPSHYGRIARIACSFTYAVFLDLGVVGTEAKSVQVADVYKPVMGGERTVFLELWTSAHEPVLVQFPDISAVLLGEEMGVLSDTRAALHKLVYEVTDRLNLMLPVVHSLAAVQRSR